MKQQVTGLVKVLVICALGGFAATGVIVAGALDALPLTAAIGIAVAVFVVAVGLAAWLLVRDVLGPMRQSPPADSDSLVDRAGD